VGAWALLRLLVGLPLHDAATHEDLAARRAGALASFVRTTASVALGRRGRCRPAFLIGLSPKWSQRLQPLIQVVASFPAPMLFPLVTILLVVLRTCRSPPGAWP